MNDSMLDGLTVVEMGTAIAGPYAGKLFADYGADVIKIEPPWGDNYRNRPGWYSEGDETGDVTHKFLQYNTNKKSLAVNLKTAEGKEVFRELVADADVLIENMRARKLANLGFDWETLQTLNPTLVYCSITGYGETGPYAEYPAYDQAMQGITGLVHQSGKGQRPGMLLLPAIDFLTSLYAANGVLMALVRRGITDEGRRIDVSMLDAGLSLLGHHWAEYSYCVKHDQEPQFTGSMEPEGVFKTGDGYMSMVVLPEHWEAFCDAIDRPEFAEETHRFATLERRFEHRDKLKTELEEILETKSTDDWMAYFATVRGAVCTPVNYLTDLPDDPQISHRDSVLTLDHPALGEYLLTAPVIRIPDTETPISHAPGLGEHTDDVLSKLGYSADDIAQLRETDIIV